MTAGEFNELAKQGRVWAKIVANFTGEYGLVEKISGLTNQFVRFRFKGKKCDTIISPENVMFEERKRKEDLKSAFAIIKVSLGITLGGLGILMIGAILETLGVIK